MSGGRSHKPPSGSARSRPCELNLSQGQKIFLQHLHDQGTTVAFVDDAGRYNRRAIMAEARRVHGMTRGRGVTFRDALRFAWGRAREAREQRLGELAAFERAAWAA